MFDKKILLVRKDTTFMVNAIKKCLLDNHFIVAETSYSISDISSNKADACLAILYTDSDFADYQDAIIYFKDLCIEENMIVIIIGDNDTFKFIHRFIPKEDIACELTRPLDMEELLNKVYIVTDEEYIQLKRKCILVVDDDFTYLQMLREWLKDDFRVGVANSGAQAIAWLTNNKADLILLDYDMPVIDGPKVMEMLKKESFSSGIPVMFLTGKNDKKSVTEVISLKPADYLLKSIDKEKLLDTLRNFFDSRE
ncbi:MAG: response regulator [Butyrivibrio sp.]|nr:response regulator [Butyrivibrio sp.]